MAIERAHRRARRPAARTVRGPRARRAPARPGDGRIGMRLSWRSTSARSSAPPSPCSRSAPASCSGGWPRARAATAAIERMGPRLARLAGAIVAAGVLRLPRALVAHREPGRHGLERRSVDLAGARPVDRHQHAPRPRGHRVHAGLRRPRHRRPAAGAPPPVAIVAGHRGHRRADVPWRRDDAVSHDARRGTPACAQASLPRVADRSSPDCRRRGRPRPGVPRAAGGRGPNARRSRGWSRPAPA